MDLWFTENLEIVPDMRLAVRVRELLYTEQTKYQRLDILDTIACGRALILDGVIMTTESDEFCYHEMITHVPLFSHPDPKRVLVIGGGDGGSVREIAKHSSVEEIHLCEIDERVVEVCKEYLPSIAASFGDPRVKCYYEDGARWVRDNKDYYDVIIVDSSDPVGPATVLFSREFYADCEASLKHNGILATQAENFLLHRDIIKKLLGYGRELFPIHRYYSTNVPTYPGGMIGFTFFSKQADVTDHLEARTRNTDFSAFRYWSKHIHTSAFTLPAEIMRDFQLQPLESVRQ